MARTRDVAGGGRAVEVEPERLAGWFARFAAAHGGLTAVDGTASALRFSAADGARATVAVPFGGLPPGPDALVAPAGDRGPAPTDPPPTDPAGGRAHDPAAAVAALHAHLVAPRRVGIVLVRLGGASVGVAQDGVVTTSATTTRPVHGRTRKGGSSSGRFARRRENQGRVALDAAADAVARVLLPAALDAVVVGGDATALATLRADRRLAALLARAEPRVLDVPEPRRAVLDEAARRARAVEIVVRDGPVK